MSQLIALVATAVMVGGVRTIIEPGQPLPELSRHDARALTESGAAQDQAASAAQAQASAGAAQAAEADFAAARLRALDESAASAASDAVNTPIASLAKSAKSAKSATKGAQNPAPVQE